MFERHSRFLPRAVRGGGAICQSLWLRSNSSAHATLSHIVDLGDFRSGSITAISGRCGKPECRCHQPNQPGHGPNFRLTRKVNGKSVSETFASAAGLRKAQREVEAFHRFRELSTPVQKVTNVLLAGQAATFSWADSLASRVARSALVNFHSKGFAVASQ